MQDKQEELAVFTAWLAEYALARQCFVGANIKFANAPRRGKGSQAFSDLGRATEEFERAEAKLHEAGVALATAVAKEMKVGHSYAHAFFTLDGHGRIRANFSRAEENRLDSLIFGEGMDIYPPSAADWVQFAVHLPALLEAVKPRAA